MGGIDQVDISILKDFDYGALGHIHRPQNMGKFIRYCGTPLAYSVSEADQEKTVTMVTMEGKGYHRGGTVFGRESDFKMYSGIRGGRR